MVRKLADQDKPGDTKGTIKAAGAVAWRPGRNTEPEILLVHRRKYDDWSLPKGKMEPGEPLPLTAVREVFEEGGARLVLGRRLTSVRYKVSGRPKRVHYWAARVTAADTGAVPNDEVDRVTWLPADKAREVVSYPQDVTVLDDFDSAPADTVPLILLRHAKAVAKGRWQGDDDDRPLDDRGQKEAHAVARLLACFAPRAEVFSSPTVRCEDTVRPYAEAAKVLVRPAPGLAVARTPRPDWPTPISTVVSSGTPAILCAHRENLPVLLEEAVGALGGGSLPPGFGGTLATAGFWVLHMRAGGAPGDGDRSGKLVGADRYELSGGLVPDGPGRVAELPPAPSGVAAASRWPAGATCSPVAPFPRLRRRNRIHATTTTTTTTRA
jgi:8-oxo-dGTP diphosphatase